MAAKSGFFSSVSAYMAAQKKMSLREKLYALLYPTPNGGGLHAYIDSTIVFMVLLSVLMIILESVEVFEKPWGGLFELLDYIAVAVFTVEYIVRVYVSAAHPDYEGKTYPRLRFILSPMALVDLLAILPFFLAPFIGHLLDIRFLRVFRLARLLKLTRYTHALKTMRQVFAREAPVLGAAAFLMMLLVLFAASLGYLFEHEAQPDKFENIPQSIYWAVITLASVGYGDLSPVTPLGRFMTIILSILGVGIFALPAGLLSSAFSDQLRLDRERFKRMVDEALEDGVLSDEEKEAIRLESERLHLGNDDVDYMMKSLMRSRGMSTLKDESGEDAVAVNNSEASSGTTSDMTGIDDPEVAFVRFNMLVSQLELLYLSSDKKMLTEKVVRNLSESSTGRKVLSAMANKD